ncbi:hypothetical protein BSIN_0920 [Burkholderia singularis]|uniref:Uncharacterized protein n=1 Tax=Burkholderia singularis TaxID=1503053 RepID=A0A238HAT4_9BURK|nr:hypothetical protein BSIN_0920 [Burkholderia singularis]
MDYGSIILRSNERSQLARRHFSGAASQPAYIRKYEADGPT